MAPVVSTGQINKDKRMKKVLLVASDKSELKGSDDSYFKCISGVGPIMAAAASSLAIKETGAEIVISVGSAGSTGRLKKGEVVSFSSVFSLDQDLSSFHLPLGATLGRDRNTVGELRSRDFSSPFSLLTSASFAHTLTDRMTSFRCDAVDMEAYGVAIAASLHSIPFYCVKIISDIIGDNSRIGDVSYSVREARTRLWEKVNSLLKEA